MPVRESGLVIPKVTWGIDTYAPIGSAEDIDVPFDNKVRDVVQAAANHGMGVAYASTELPDHVHRQIENARDALDEVLPADYDQDGARYWSVFRIRVGSVCMREHMDFADQQGQIVSEVLGKKARRIKSVLNVMDPFGVGDSHTDDFLTLLYAKGDARISILNADGEPVAEAAIQGSGIAAFCGEQTPERLGFSIEAQRHRVENPSSSERTSLGIGYTFSPLTLSWTKFFATEILKIRK